MASRSAMLPPRTVPLGLKLCNTVSFQPPLPLGENSNRREANTPTSDKPGAESITHSRQSILWAHATAWRHSWPCRWWAFTAWQGSF